MNDALHKLTTVQKGKNGLSSKISILLETTGGILFSLEGFQKMLITIKTLRRVIYIPLEGFRCPSWGVIMPLEGFRYPS